MFCLPLDCGIFTFMCPSKCFHVEVNVTPDACAKRCIYALDMGHVKGTTQGSY